MIALFWILFLKRTTTIAIIEVLGGYILKLDYSCSDKFTMDVINKKEKRIVSKNILIYNSKYTTVQSAYIDIRWEKF